MQMDMEIDIRIHYPQPIHTQYGSLSENLYNTKLRNSGDIWDITADNSRILFNGKKEHARHNRLIWDGKDWLSYVTRDDQPNSPEAAVRHKNDDYQYVYRTYAPFLFGHLDYDKPEENCITLLLKSESLYMQEAFDNVDGHPCRKIHGNIDKNYYTIWIDPQSGYNIRKALIVRNAIDSEFYGSNIVSRIDEMNNTTIKQCDGNYFLSSATFTSHMTSSSGTKLERIIEASIKEIKRNPNFETLGAFKMDIPSHTIVYDLDFAIKYQWEDGKLSPYISKEDTEFTSDSAALINTIKSNRNIKIT